MPVGSRRGHPTGRRQEQVESYRGGYGVVEYRAVPSLNPKTTFGRPARFRGSAGCTGPRPLRTDYPDPRRRRPGSRAPFRLPSAGSASTPLGWL